MKATKILNIIKRFLSADKAKQYKQSKNLKIILKKLKRKELALKKKLKSEKNVRNLKLIKLELATVYAKRKKGINAVIQLKNTASGIFIADKSPIT